MTVFIGQKRGVLGARPGWLVPGVFANGLQYELTRDQYWLGSGPTAQGNVLTNVRNSDALFDNAAGVYSTFGTDVPAITDRGLYPGGQRTNRYTGFNANPVNTSGWTLNNAPNGLGVFSVVDDAAALAAAGLSGVCTSGNVYKADNTLGNGSIFLYGPGGTANTNKHSVSCYWRGNGAGQSRIGVQNNAGALATPPADYARVTATVFPSFNGAQWLIEVQAGAVVYFILNQLEEASFASPPIVTAGAAATRLADSIVNPNFAAHAAAFGFASGMAALARVNLTRLSDPADRTILHLGNDTEYARLDFTTANKFRLTVRKLGPELWASPSLGTGWVDNGGGSYTHTGTTGSNLSDVALTLDSVFSAQWTQSGGQFIAVYPGTLGASPISNSNVNGDYTEIFTAAGDTFTFRSSADGATVSAISVREVITRTLESGVVGSTGVYDVTATLDPGAYALTVSGGVTGDTDASAETLPAAIANACYIASKEDTTLHLNGPLERLAMWGV